MSAKGATRLGDRDIHHDCQTPLRNEASDNVFVNQIGWSRFSDRNTPHKFGPKCKSTHAQPIAIGSRTVFINQLGAGRITDRVAACTAVAEASDNVFAGD